MTFATITSVVEEIGGAWRVTLDDGSAATIVPEKWPGAAPRVGQVVNLIPAEVIGPRGGRDA